MVQIWKWAWCPHVRWLDILYDSNTVTFSPHLSHWTIPQIMMCVNVCVCCTHIVMQDTFSFGSLITCVVFIVMCIVLLLLLLLDGVYKPSAILYVFVINQTFFLCVSVLLHEWLYLGVNQLLSLQESVSDIWLSSQQKKAVPQILMFFQNWISLWFIKKSLVQCDAACMITTDSDRVQKLAARATFLISI